MRGGHLIREARRRAGLSQADLASRAGTAQSGIARWESGRTTPSLDDVRRLVRLCGFDVEVVKALPAAFVQDTNEVDDGVGAFERRID